MYLIKILDGTMDSPRNTQAEENLFLTGQFIPRVDNMGLAGGSDNLLILSGDPGVVISIISSAICY